MSDPRVSRPEARVDIRHLTPTQRTALAWHLAVLREDGISWDGPSGICLTVGIANAVTGRVLLREIGREDLIGDSYDREAQGPAYRSKRGWTP